MVKTRPFKFAKGTGDRFRGCIRPNNAAGTPFGQKKTVMLMLGLK